MVKWSGCMVLNVQLLEKGSNKPIQFVDVRLIGNNNREYVDDTDVNGIADFNYNPIDEGQYIVKVRSPHHRPYTEKHYLTNHSRITITLQKAYE